METIDRLERNDRLKIAINHLRSLAVIDTDKDIAAKMGADPSNVSRHLNGKPQPSDKFLTRFNDAFGNIFNSSWLLDGEGDMLRFYTPDNGRPDTFSDVDIGEQVYLTYLLPQSALAGSLVGFGADGIIPEDCEKVISPIAGVDFAITVYGESMLPDLPPGSRILIKKINHAAFIAWGDVFVLDTTNGVIVKELQPSERDDHVVCHSHNPNGRYKDFTVALSDIRAIYRVLACIIAK